MTFERLNRALSSLLLAFFVFLASFCLYVLLSGHYPSSLETLMTLKRFLTEYQTLITGAVAIYAARSAWNASLRTIDRLDRGNKLAIEQNSIMSIDHIKNRLRTLNSLYKRLNECKEVMDEVDYDNALLQVHTVPMGKIGEPERRIRLNANLQIESASIRDSILQSEINVQPKWQALQTILNEEALTAECRNACETLVYDAISLYSIGDNLRENLNSICVALLRDEDISSFVSNISKLEMRYRRIKNGRSFYDAALVVGAETRKMHSILDRTLSSIEAES